MVGAGPTPGAPWVVPMLAAFAIVSLGIPYWGSRDAARRGSDHAAAWGVGMLLLGVVGLAIYLVARRNLDAPATPPSRAQRLVRNLVVATVLVLLAEAVAAPPDLFSQSAFVAVWLPILVGVAVLVTYRDVVTSAR